MSAVFHLAAGQAQQKTACGRRGYGDNAQLVVRTDRLGVVTCKQCLKTAIFARRKLRQAEAKKVCL